MKRSDWIGYALLALTVLYFLAHLIGWAIR